MKYIKIELYHSFDGNGESFCMHKMCEYKEKSKHVCPLSEENIAVHKCDI